MPLFFVRSNMKKLFEGGTKAPERRDDFPELREGEVPRMKNEGGYEFSLEESEVRSG